jgi:uncharacterized protein (DUF362 family)
MDQKPRVFIDQFNIDSIDDRIKSALKWIKCNEIIKPGSRLFVKPNLTWREPTPGVTVTPIFLKKLIENLLPLTPNITIGESEGGQACFSAEDAFKNHGLYTLAKDYGIRIINLSKDHTQSVQMRIAGKNIKIELPRTLLHDVDVFMTVPVPKMHALTVASLGLKNQWGCLGDKMRVTQHPQFNRAIIAINKAVKTRICIFDGTYFLDHTGPLMGKPIPMNLIIAADNVGAASLACCGIMGIDQMMIPHYRIARDEGLLPKSLEDIEFNRFPGEFNTRKFSLKRSFINYIHLAAFKIKWINRLFYDSPFADHSHKILWHIRRNALINKILYGEYGSGEAKRGGNYHS